MFYPHQYNNDANRSFDSTNSFNPECTHRKKQIDHSNEFVHKKKCDFELTTKIVDEMSYLRWFANVKNNVKNAPEFGKYMVLDLVPVDYDCRLKYTEKVLAAEDHCLDNPHVSQDLNLQLIQTLPAELYYLISFNYTFNCNFEAVKSYFAERINAFYLLSVENHLTFDTAHVLQFLIDLDNVCRVYKFVFRENPAHQLKLQWIMNAINKDPVNNAEILQLVQQNWEKINLDHMFIRRMLTNYSNSRLKLKQ